MVVKAIPATNCLSETLSSAKGESSSDERIESGLTKIQPIGSDGFLTFILSGAHSNIGSAENSDSDENINNSIETDSSQTK